MVFSCILINAERQIRIWQKEKERKVSRQETPASTRQGSAAKVTFGNAFQPSFYYFIPRWSLLQTVISNLLLVVVCKLCTGLHDKCWIERSVPLNIKPDCGLMYAQLLWSTWLYMRSFNCASVLVQSSCFAALSRATVSAVTAKPCAGPWLCHMHLRVLGSVFVEAPSKVLWGYLLGCVKKGGVSRLAFPWWQPQEQ